MKLLWFLVVPLALAQIHVLNPLPTETGGIGDISFEQSIEQEYDPVLWGKLEAIEYCESRNDPSAIGDHGLAIGVMQFHFSTFLAFSQKYNLYPNAEEAEVWNLYPDSDEQRRLAYLMLRDGGFSHWKICSEKLGFL